MDGNVILISVIVILVIGLLSLRRTREHIFNGFKGLPSFVTGFFTSCFGLIVGCFGLLVGGGCLLIILSIFFGPAMMALGIRIFQWIYYRAARIYCSFISDDKCGSTELSMNFIFQTFN